MTLMHRRLVWAGAAMGLPFLLFRYVPLSEAEYSGLYKAAFVFVYAFAIIPALWAGFVIMWWVYPYAYWVFWKYLCAVEWITRLPLGTKFCDFHMDDSFLLNSTQNSSNAWLYRQFFEDSKRRKGMGQID